MIASLDQGTGTIAYARHSQSNTCHNRYWPTASVPSTYSALIPEPWCGTPATKISQRLHYPAQNRFDLFWFQVARASSSRRIDQPRYSFQAEAFAPLAYRHAGEIQFPSDLSIL